MPLQKPRPPAQNQIIQIQILDPPHQLIDLAQHPILNALLLHGLAHQIHPVSQPQNEGSDRQCVANPGVVVGGQRQH